MNKKRNQNKTEKELTAEIELLKKEHLRLEIENKVLKKANELLKKELGTNYSLITNKEKVLIVSALKSEYKLKELLNIVNLTKSTYFYEIKLIDFDKYSNERSILKQLFYDNYMCYGYRRLKIVYEKETGKTISEKIIRRIMKEENLIVYQPKKRKYSSYKGEISPEVDNIINRNFQASQPFLL